MRKPSQILANHLRQPIPLPDAVLRLVLTKERLGKSAEPKQRVKVRRGRRWVIV